MRAILAAIIVCSSPWPEAFAKRGKGALRVISSVDGALITINGKRAGEAPLKPFAISAGRYTVKVTALGHMPFSERVRVLPGKTATVFADPLPVRGVLRVVARPHGAQVVVDGKQVGTAPYAGEVAPGTRTVNIKHPGFENSQHDLEFTPGEVRVLDITLAKLQLDDVALVPLPSPVANQATPITVPSVDKSAVSREPWYKKWWVWTAVGAVAAGTVTVMMLRNDNSEGPPPVDDTWVLGR